jgi:hypothetical protein
MGTTGLTDQITTAPVIRGMPWFAIREIRGPVIREIRGSDRGVIAPLCGPARGEQPGDFSEAREHGEDADP